MERYCDHCFTPVQGVCYGLEESFDICQECHLDLDAVFDGFLLIKKTDKLYQNDRETILVANQLDEMSVPEGLVTSITEDRKETYLDMLDSLVRPLGAKWNILGWALFTEVTEVPCFDAMCGLIVSCEPGSNNPVASILSDNHGRVAVNLLYNSFQEYLKEYQQWEGERDHNLEPYLTEVRKSFEEAHDCDDALLMKATDSFSVYIRIKRKISLYYG